MWKDADYDENDDRVGDGDDDNNAYAGLEKMMLHEWKQGAIDIYQT